MSASNPVNPDDFFQRVAARLDRFELVPDGVLSQVVTSDGACMLLYRLDLEPEWTGDVLTDRELAARICAGCTVREQCLELDLRTSGSDTVGVWGALPAEDLRAVYPVWRARRRSRQLGDEGGQSGAGDRR